MATNNSKTNKTSETADIVSNSAEKANISSTSTTEKAAKTNSAKKENSKTDFTKKEDDQAQKAKSAPEEKKNNGTKNLIILGIIAVVIPLITTSISLYVYHQSGDIYLDRSRPGFLPDKKETEEKEEQKDYSFPDSGKITEKTLNEYLKNFNEDTNDLRKMSSPYSDAPLTNDSLGI